MSFFLLFLYKYIFSTGVKADHKKSDNMSPRPCDSCKQQAEMGKEQLRTNCINSCLSKWWIRLIWHCSLVPFFLHTYLYISCWSPSVCPWLLIFYLSFQKHYPFSHPTQMKDQGGPGVPQQPLSPAQLPEDAECLTVPKYKRDLVQKLKILRQELSQQQPQAGHCRIEVCREEIFEVKQARNTTFLNWEWHYDTRCYTLIC